MTGETVIYNPKDKLTVVERTLELQQRILNPGSAEQEQRLIARSAVKQIEKRLSVEKALELQKKIVTD